MPVNASPQAAVSAAGEVGALPALCLIMSRASFSELRHYLFGVFLAGIFKIFGIELHGGFALARVYAFKAAFKPCKVFVGGHCGILLI